MREARALLRSHASVITRAECSARQFRTTQGHKTLRHAHSFLVGRDVSVSMGDLKAQIENRATIVDRIVKHGSEQEARARGALDTTELKQPLGNSLLREYLPPLSGIAGTLLKHDPTIRRSFDLPRRRKTEGLMQLPVGRPARRSSGGTWRRARGL